MKTILIFFIVLACIIASCSRYDSNKYTLEENQAIKELLPELVDLEYMLLNNEYGHEIPKLIMMSTLFYMKSEPEYCDLINDDRKKLRPLLEGKISQRLAPTNLNDYFNNIDIHLMSEKEFEIDNVNGLSHKIDNQKLFGHFAISRIIFYNNYKLGYTYYSYFCGQECAWGSYIEIEKVNNKWRIKRSFCEFAS